jgi:hypothetical protein
VQPRASCAAPTLVYGSNSVEGPGLPSLCVVFFSARCRCFPRVPAPQPPPPSCLMAIVHKVVRRPGTPVLSSSPASRRPPAPSCTAAAALLAPLLPPYVFPARVLHLTHLVAALDSDCGCGPCSCPIRPASGANHGPPSLRLPRLPASAPQGSLVAPCMQHAVPPCIRRLFCCPFLWRSCTPAFAREPGLPVTSHPTA